MIKSSKGYCENIYINKLGKRESIVVTGSRGTGKTNFICNLIDGDFRDLLLEANKGEKNLCSTVSSVNERVIKYNITNSVSVKEMIFVSVKPMSAAEFSEQFNDILAESFCGTVLKFRTGDAENFDVTNYFADRFVRAFKESIFSEFFENEIDEFVDNIDFSLRATDMMYIYNVAKNRISKNDKSNDLAVKEAIREQIFLRSDLSLNKFINDFVSKDDSEEEDIELLVEFKIGSILSMLDDKIKSYFKNTFGDNDVSKDGYYMRSFKLENLVKEEKELLRKIVQGEGYFLFTDEVMFGVPMNKNVEAVIKEQGDTRLVNRYGDITLSIYDYSYDVSESINKNYKVLEDFVYERNINGLVVFRDINKKNEDKVLTEIAKNLNKYIDLFVVDNKMDIFIDKLRLRMNKKREDILLVEGSNSFEFSMINDDICEKLISKTSKAKLGIVASFKKLQSSKKKPMDIHMSYMFSDYIRKPEAKLIKEYAPINFVRLLVENLAKPKVKALNVEIKGKCSNISVDLLKIEEILENILKSKDSKKVFLAIKQNITENLGLEVDRETFREVKQKIKKGETVVYSSEKACMYGGVNIQFPSNFKNIITENLIKEVIDKAVSFGDIEQTNQTKEVMVNEVIKLRGNIAREVVQYLLYSEFKDTVIENSVQKESVIFDKYLTRLYDNVISLERGSVGLSSSKEALNQINFKENLIISLGKSVEGYLRLIFREEGSY